MIFYYQLYIIMKEILKKNIKIPFDKRSFFSTLILILIPNLVPFLFASSINIARPIINFDYLPVFLLLVFPSICLRILGIVLLWIVGLVDIIMLAIQLFPFADLNALIYLAPFLFDAPPRYLFSAIISILYLLILPYVIIASSNKLKIKPNYILIWIAISWVYYNFFSYYLTYKIVPPQFFGHHNYYIAHSQYILYKVNHDTGFLRALNEAPILISGQEARASNFLVQPYSKKILFITAESWGQAREEKVTRAVLEKIYAKQSQLDFIEQGYFDFYGATVQGELRELCQLNTESSSGFGLSKIPAKDFAQCLPNLLKQKSYHTVAMHGAGRMLYDRYDWYPKAGFEKTYFSEDLLDRKRCSVFKGVCDNDLLDIVSKEFSNHDKAFFYWLTLTSHASWSEKDMVNPRLDCKTYNLFEGDICNSFKLHAQFFDDLSTLIDLPEMRGVEVIVVGDHMPPIVTTKPIHENLRWQDVAWLHFKIKE